jgi:small-conductance mechanosensitive channel
VARAKDRVEAVDRIAHRAPASADGVTLALPGSPQVCTVSRVVDRTDLTALIVAGSCAVGGIVAASLLRWLFARLGRRALQSRLAREQASGGDLIPRTWAELGWALLKGLAIPAGVSAGLWAAAEAVQLREPMRGILDRLLLVAVVLAVAVAAARLAGGVIGSIAMARAGVDQSASIFVNLTRGAILAVGVLVALQSLGISITPMLGALGVGALAIALALQDTLANLFAGIQILASKKVQPGDFVQLDSGEDGYVVDITWRNTTVRQLAGNIVVVPNSHFANAIVTNFHQPAEDLSVRVQVGVSYGSDLEHVERVTIEVATDVMATVEGGVPNFEPFIRYHTFGDSSINFTVIMRGCEYTATFLITHEFIKRLHARYRAEGIEIPFPIRTLVTPDGDRPVPLVPAARSEPSQ